MPTCTRALLTTAVGNGQNAIAMNRAQYNWAKIWLKILQLAANGGTDYRADFNKLITDATELAKTVGPGERRVMWLNILRNQALAAGSIDTSLGAGVGGLNIPTSCCLQPFSDPEAIDLLLSCKLGAGRNPPV